MSSLLLISQGDEGLYKASDFDQAVIGLNRKPFKKRKIIGSKHVWLELTDMKLEEYDSSNNSKVKHTDVLNSESIDYTVSDGSKMIGEPFTIMLSKVMLYSRHDRYDKNGKHKLKKSDPIRTFYVAESAKTFEVWLRYLRRIIGANKVVSNNIDSGLHIQMWSDPACVTDIDGNIIDVNEPLCKLFGYERSELIGQHNTIFMPRLVAAKHDSYMKRYEESGAKKIIGQSRVVSAIMKNGQQFQIHLKIDEVVSSNGDLNKQYVATMKDSAILTLDNDFSLQKKESADACTLDPVLNNVVDDVMQSMIAQLKSALSHANETSALKLSYALSANRELEKQNKRLQSAILESELYASRLEALNTINRRALDLMNPNTDSDDTDRARSAEFLRDMCATYPAETSNLSAADFNLVQSILTDIDHEISKTSYDSINILFREDDEHTQRIRSFMFVVGGSWLYTTLKDAVSYVMLDIDTLDPDIFYDNNNNAGHTDPKDLTASRTLTRKFSIKKMKSVKEDHDEQTGQTGQTAQAPVEHTQVDSDSSDDTNVIKLVKNADKFVRRVDRIFKAIINNIDGCPFMIRYVVSYLKQKIEEVLRKKTDDDRRISRSATEMLRAQDKSDSTITSILTGLLFLRFFVPAISQPSAYGLIRETQNVQTDRSDLADQINQTQISPVLSRNKMSPKTSQKLPKDEKEPDQNALMQTAQLKRVRVWSMMAKSIQFLANDSSFPNRSNSVAIDVMNLFLSKNRQKIGMFVEAVCLSTTSKTI